MITIFQTGEFDYSDIEIDKPVRYSMENLIEVASRTPNVNITKEHTKEVIGVMSNFIVKDGLLMAEEPNNLELSGMGFSPVFTYDLYDMGEYYEPRNIQMTEIGYTKNPRTKIVYNSIVVPNGDRMDDSEIQKLVKRNNELQEEIGVLKNQAKQFNNKLKQKDKEIKDIKEGYSEADAKLKEYDSLKKIEASYNKLISSKRDDLIHRICGDDKKKAEKYADFSDSQLETTVELIEGQSAGGRGVTPRDTDVDDGNTPNPHDQDEDTYTDEMFEEDFKNSGL